MAPFRFALVVLVTCGLGGIVAPVPAEGQLSAVFSDFWAEGLGGLPLVAEDFDYFGRAVAVGDFDGDGYADLAIGAPGEDVSTGPITTVINAGVVIVLYGTSSGLASAGAQTWRQGASGLLGTPEEGDFFGWALAAGDFNGDGHDDLAVGAPLHDYSNQTDSGEIQVLYGSGSGLVATGNDSWPTFYFSSGNATSGFKTGHSLATGDFNGDGYADLAAGVPGGSDDGGTGSLITGGVLIFEGSASGLVTPTNGSDYLDPSQDLGLPASDGIGTFGTAVAATDFDLDGRDDLVVGAPTSGCPPLGWNDCGSVHVAFGSAAGLTGTGALLQYGPGIFDHLGSSLTVGNIASTSGANPPEVAIGAPGAEVSGFAGAGRMEFCQIYDGAFHACGWMDQDFTGVAGAAEIEDGFGASLAAADFDGDGRADVAVGGPRESYSAARDGVVHILRGTAGGMTASGSQYWHQNAPGVPDEGEADDNFGQALAVGDFNGDGRPDLAIGVPNEPLSGQRQGAVIVLYAEAPNLIFADDFETGNSSRWN